MHSIPTFTKISLMNFLTRLLSSTLAIIVVAYFMKPHVHVDDALTAIVLAVVLAFLNTIIKPVLIFLTLPITIVSLGLFLLVINAGMILIAARLIDGFSVEGFGWALLFSIILSIVTGIFNSFAEKKTNGE